MESIKEIYRIGAGPSASHTMGPRRAAEIMLKDHPDAAAFKVQLFGSLAATGKGHLTDKAIREILGERLSCIEWKPQTVLPRHPNGMQIECLDDAGARICKKIFYSTGGGALAVDGGSGKPSGLYALRSLTSILDWTDQTGNPIWGYAVECEGAEILEYMQEVWLAMKTAISRGIKTQGVLPGPLRLPRKAASYYTKARLFDDNIKCAGLLFAYALAVSEENASGGVVVTAPTCGSCGTLPAVLKNLQESMDISDEDILYALLTAGIIGNLVKKNASISGAEVGCQGEVGTACAMAAGAAAQLLGATPRQVEYAAEMGMEHHLGLTCDPVGGTVQIPCIERNAFAATRALNCAEYALLSDGRHRISFDDVVETMKQTGRDMLEDYRETSEGGLAAVYRLPQENQD